MKRINSGNYQDEMTVIVDNVEKKVIVSVWYNNDNKMWYASIDGIGEMTEYIYDNYFTKSDCIKAVKSLRKWQYFKGLGYCVVD